MNIGSIRSSHIVIGSGAAMLLAGATVSARAFSQARGLTGDAEHGRYIVREVAMCVECHSPRDEKGDLIQSQELKGGAVPVRPPWTNDWALVAPRIQGLPGYDDEQATRLLSEGAIGRDGSQLRPPMPRFHMTKQDAADVTAYLRSLK